MDGVQERGLRAVYCNKSATYEELLQMAELPTLRNRRLQEIAIIMYRVKNGISPAYIPDTFAANPSHYALRNSDLLVPRFNTVTHGKHSTSYLGPTLWAKLSKNLKKLKALFKKRITTMTVKTVFYVAIR